MKHSRAINLLAFWITLGFCAAGRAQEWPQFRGPGGLSHTPETGLCVSWGGADEENVVWKSPLVGEGHASPIVWQDRVFVASARWSDSSADKEKVVPEHHMTCYRAADGKQLWDVLVPPGPWVHGDFRGGPGGGYAVPTPATDGQHVFCVFGSAVIAALDFDGRLVWRHEITPLNFDVTISTSPVIYRDMVILLCARSGARDSRITAYDQRTGTVRWESELAATSFAHTTPVIIELAGQSQMLVLASGRAVVADALQSFDPADGRRLWWCRGAGEAASVAFGGGLVYFDSGRGGEGTAVDPGGAGDVTATHVKWTIPRVSEGIGSPLVVGEHVYRLHEPSVLRCWHAATGKEVYAERLDGLSTTWASPIADGDGRLYFASAGKSFVVQSGPEFRLLAENDLGDPNHASPAVAAGRMYLVGLQNLYCVGRKQ